MECSVRSWGVNTRQIDPIDAHTLDAGSRSLLADSRGAGSKGEATGNEVSQPVQPWLPRTGARDLLFGAFSSCESQV